MKGRRVIYLLGAVAAATAALVLPGTAGAANNLVCGGTIDTSVTLPAGMDCSGTSANALTITKSGVTLNLGGNTLAGNSDYDVIDIADGASNVTVENGTITGGYDQINALGHADYLTIQNMKMSGAYYIGIRLDGIAGGLIQNNNITGAGWHDIRSFAGAGNAFFSNVLSDVGGYYGTSSAYTMYLKDEQNSYVEGNTSYISGNSNESYRNFSDQYGDGNLWYGNVAYGGARGYYMYADEDGTITMTDNGAAGQSDGYGFYIEDYFTWANNPSGAYTLINGNTATGGINGTDGFYTDFNVGDTFTNNTANRNDGDGFYVDEPWKETVTNNVSKFNNGDGFYLDTYGDEGTPTLFGNNTAWYNQGWGFESVNATVGSGNTGLNGGAATNNGGECLGVLGCN
jgi:hypothetical protein